ncbi:MAG: ribosome silencing factor [Leptolyngbyaceae cyanobacterium]
MTDSQNAMTSVQSLAEQTTVTPSAEDSALALAQAIATAADDRKGADIRILKVVEVSYLADYFVIVTGFSAAQVRAISSSMLETAAVNFARRPLRLGGPTEGSWILQDYGEVIAHVFMPDEREYYGLEAFWGHAEDVPLDSAS